ncbi:HAMP domain-containing histidine kinase [Candidatus Saccharibacteria bacterium]|nr:HAMP domain-containing histidine kinase [Candidatus Saccharibacteria bacterium]
MFHSAAVKLTVWYLVIIMVVSLIFSVSLYHVSGDQLGRNVNRQIGYFNNFLGPDETTNYGLLRQHQLDEDLRHLKNNLIFFNLLVLIGGGAASYWLARRTLEPIEQALQTQTRFASDASHELRTPLTVIQTENEVALRDKELTKSRAVDLLKSNLEEVAKLKAISEGLLRLANGGGRIENPEPVSLKEVGSQAVDRLQKNAQTAKITIENKLTDVRVMGDQTSLVEMLSVFLDNAIKYSDAGDKVRVDSVKKGRQIALRVKDTGRGINAEDLPHIFDRFYQADSSRNKASSSGYGLGLAIASSIAEAHRGHIEVASTPGKGTLFTIFLPAA